MTGTRARPRMRAEVRGVVTGDGRLMVLLDCDHFHVLMPPEQALTLAAAITETACALIAQRN